MALSGGTRLGTHELVASLGAGGMGEVYRARDTHLDRDVAIKILPELFAADPDRLMRFEREAKTLAALNHPNIAQIYGTVGLPPEGGSHGGSRGGSHGGSHTVALVIELVDGEDRRTNPADCRCTCGDSLRVIRACRSRRTEAGSPAGAATAARSSTCRQPARSWPCR
jgi:serine/threonine protein kinase